MIECDCGAHKWARRPAAASDNVSRGQLAGALPEFDLDRGMLNAEALVKLCLNVNEEVTTRMSRWHDEMTGQRCFRGAHWPDMEIVHLGDAGQLLKELRTLPGSMPRALPARTY